MRLTMRDFDEYINLEHIYDKTKEDGLEEINRYKDILPDDDFKSIKKTYLASILNMEKYPKDELVTFGLDIGSYNVNTNLNVNIKINSIERFSSKHITTASINHDTISGCD